MFANFLFSSPLRLEENIETKAFDMYTTPESWINVGTVIYIDQPVGTGFSAGTPLLDNMGDVTTEFVYFMT